MKNNQVSNIPQLSEGGDIINNPLDKSNILNSYFASKSHVDGADDAPPILPKRPVSNPLHSFSTSHIEVSKIIRTLKKSNSSYCGIPAKFLSLIATPISFSLTQLFNNLFSVGVFPDCFKMAHITAIWKRSGLKSSKLQYRPISLLPTLSKVCESILHDRLLSHFLDNNIISDRQAAYLKGDSTTHHLIYLIHRICQSWTRGEVTHGLFLDVKAAFDKVWHAGLISKLDSVCVEGKALDTLQSYLSNRKQVVVVDGVKSNVADVHAGIPQGSRLGPLLFILYIDDLLYDLESECLIFADDTSLLASAKDVSLTSAILNRDLIRIVEWSQKWKVTFNPSKSEDIIFTNKSLPHYSPVISHLTLTGFHRLS